MAAAVYIGIKLEWDYVHRTVTLPIPSYVCKVLHRLQHIMRGGKEYSLHTCAPINYGQKIQYADPLDAADYLLDKETNLVQQVCGNFLYYSTTIDNTILPALRKISSEQSKATTNTSKQVSSLLIHTRKFSTGQVGCNYPYILTRHTFHTLSQESWPVGSILSEKVHLNLTIQKISCRPPTEFYSLCARLCATSWRKQMRPNMAPSSSMTRQMYLSAPPYMKWDGNRDPWLSNLTIPLQWASQLRILPK